MPTYTRSKKDGTDEIDMFVNWEPYQGDISAAANEKHRAISAEYFENTGDTDNDRGYLLYEEEITRGAIPEYSNTDNKNWLTYGRNEIPFTGCRKGSLVKAHSRDKALYETNTWDTGEGTNTGTYYLQYSMANNCLHCGTNEAADSNPAIDGTQNLWRIGIVLVGCGGSCGKDNVKKYDSSSSEWDIKFPGAGGGGACTVWAVLKIRDEVRDTNNNLVICCPKFKIVIPQGPTSEGAAGSGASVTVVAETINGQESSISEYHLFTAGGGGAGGAGSGSSASGGVGGSITINATNSKYHRYIDHMDGKSGAGYRNISIDNESADIDKGEELKFYIKFLDDSMYQQEVWNSTHSFYGTIKEMKDTHGNAWLAVPGGNSYGSGGYIYSEPAPSDKNPADHFKAPGVGGGGIGCANQTSGSDNWQNYNKGGNAYFALYY